MVTFVTHERRPFLAEMRYDVAMLTQAGKVVEQCWLDLPRHFPEVQLDAFQIMPDHVHAILILRAKEQDGRYVQPGYDLSKVICALKVNAAREINLVEGRPGRKVWQKSYMDRVIRNEAELNKFRRYILGNPMMADLER